MPASTNPATGEQIASYDEHTAEEVTGFVEQAQAQHRTWRRASFDQRTEVLRATADRLDGRVDELAELMAAEMGKPLAAGRSEVEKCAWACRYYADHGAEHLGDIDLDADRARSYVHHEPLGVVLAVMPWNFPFWRVFRFAAPALLAGNAGLLKHASNTTGCAVAIEELFREGGAPEDLFRTLKIPSRRVESVLEHPLVRAATLTGSVAAGSAVAETAGRLLKKTVLELGGSDPYVVLADADVEAAAKTCATSPLINSGQSCIAAKRFIVVDEVHDAFVAQMEAAVMGHPFDEGTTVGPQARSRCATSCTTRSSARSPRVPGWSSAARCPTDPAPGTRPPS